MKKRSYVLLVVLLAVALLGLSACGGKAEEEKPVAAPAATDTPKAPQKEEEAKPTATPKESAPESTATPEKPSPTPESPPPPTPTPEPAEEDLSVSALKEGLVDLDSYRIEMQMTVEGKDENGEPFRGTWEMLEETTRDPEAQRVTVSSTGSDAGETGAEGSFEMINVADMSYMITESAPGERNCISFSSDEEDLLEMTFLRPDSLGGIEGAKYRGRETVNGIRTKHYTWSEKTAALFGFADGKGEAWVAVDGGYVVKYRMEASGKGTFLLDQLVEGKMTIEYNLTEVDSGLVIEVPDECEGGASDIPVMADAQDKASFGAMMTYTTPSAMKDVVAFYEAGMSENGWKEAEQGMQMEGMSILNYTKEDRSAQLMITYDEDSKLTTVMITTE